MGSCGINECQRTAFFIRPAMISSFFFSGGFLPPTKEVWGKVMFLHLSVSHSVHSGQRSGRYASYWNAYLLFLFFVTIILEDKFFEGD